MRMSIIFGFCTLALFAGLLLLSLNAQAISYGILYLGIAVFAVLTLVFFRKERRSHIKASSLGIWMVLAVVVAFIVMFLILPAIP